MRVVLDSTDKTTAHAFLDAGEFLSDAQAQRARKRARQLGAKRVRIYRRGRDELPELVRAYEVPAA